MEQILINDQKQSASVKEEWMFSLFSLLSPGRYRPRSFAVDPGLQRSSFTDSRWHFLSNFCMVFLILIEPRKYSHSTAHNLKQNWKKYPFLMKVSHLFSFFWSTSKCDITAAFD